MVYDGQISRKAISPSFLRFWLYFLFKTRSLKIVYGGFMDRVTLLQGFVFCLSQSRLMIYYQLPLIPISRHRVRTDFRDCYLRKFGSSAPKLIARLFIIAGTTFLVVALTVLKSRVRNAGSRLSLRRKPTGRNLGDLIGHEAQ
jgi:hypothetical protein